MQARIENGKLIIEIALIDAVPSSSGKSLLIVQGGAQKPGIQHMGRPVTVSVNAFIPAK